MSEKDQVRINFRVPKEVDDLLALYQEQTGIAMSGVVRQVIAGWVDSTVQLRGSTNFGSEWRRTGVWMPRKLAAALKEKVETLSLTRGQVISRLVFNYLKGKVREGSKPSQDWKADPALLREGLRQLYQASKGLSESFPSKELTDALALAQDLLGEELNDDGPAAACPTEPTEADAVA